MGWRLSSWARMLCEPQGRQAGHVLSALPASGLPPPPCKLLAQWQGSMLSGPGGIPEMNLRRRTLWFRFGSRQ